MTYREVWNWGKEILRHAGIPEADLDAWFLLEYVTGMTKTQYYVRDQEEMDSAKRKAYEEYIKRRGFHFSTLQESRNSWDILLPWMRRY